MPAPSTPTPPDAAIAPHPEPVETAVSDTAIAWFSKLNSGAASAADHAQFEAWRGQHPAHAQAYADIERFWTLLDAPAQRVFEQAQAPLPVPRPLGRQRRQPVRRAKWWRLLSGMALAASLLLALDVADTLRFWASDYHTPQGERREFTLADGTRVALNSHSALSVAYSDAQRRVNLLAGEAYFQVARNPARPFVVATAHGNAQVTGTAFNVYAQAQRTTVTVSEGRVKVYNPEDPSRSLELTADQQASSDGRSLSPVAVVDAQQTSAWRSGLLIFNMQPLATVVDELNRHLAGRILITDPRIRELVVSGAFDLSSPQDVLTAIEKTLGLKSFKFSGLLTLLYRP